jgi:hypothetical protein
VPKPNSDTPGNLLEKHLSKSRCAARARTVPERDLWELLGMALSEKQIPQIIENTEKPKEIKELLESVGPRPRQARYRLRYAPTGNAL